MQENFSDVDRKITALVWGGTVSELIFKRWSQGFEWSVDERCALIQQFGGPCAVIAPVQGYFLQKLLFDDGGGECLPQNNAEADLENISESERDKFFAMALVSMLTMMNKSSWTLCVSNSADNCKSSITEGGSSQISSCLTDSPIHDFHSSLRLRKCSCETELHSFLLNDLSSFMSPFGVLKFLYSVILSKGVDNVINEMDNPDVPLIDSIHGHGSQNLINLLICGQAVSNVFDGNRDVAGLCLRGIPNPCHIGFLTLLEKLRYCTVGTYLKRPKYPVWLLGSETHLSVLFSRECSLVAPDSILDRAHKIFDQYDPEGLCN
uniref:Ubiquitin carboxyl-terminal hydrolase MINDY n=1 Tax=Phallusia mammillata TaxID=59560 RepID=A0A6F9DKX1_9ASCI|nr:protein FAM188A [Phallusia mammillata]